MNEPWSREIDDLRARLSALIDRTDLGDDARELASEALEELAVVIEEIQTQNAELISGRSTLEQERRRYRDLFETVPDGYLVTDAQGLIREANATACELFGQPRNRVENKPLAAYIGASDQSAFYTHLHRLTSTGQSQLTMNLTIQDHVTLPANLRATAVTSSLTGETEIRWLIHDRRPEITTQELRISEERLRALFNTAGVGILLCDLEGRIVFVNQQADHVLSRRPTDTALAQWLATTHDDDRDKLHQFVRSALDHGHDGTLRHRVSDDNSIQRWVDHTVVPLRGPDGTINGSVSTLADVTAEQISRLQLQETLDFTEAVVNTVGALIIVLDRHGQIQSFNKACETATGFTANDVIGRSVFDQLIPTEQRTAAEDLFTSLTSLTATPRTAENEWVTADGRRRLISWTNTVLTNNDGDITTVIGTGLDVTDQRLLETQLAQADRLDSIGRLAAGIAHDFNNTLTTLMMRIGRLHSRHLDQASAHDLNEAQSTIDRSQTLIADLLSFSRTQDLTPTTIDLNSECQRIMAMLGELIGSDVTIDLHLTADDTTALIDPGRFDQALTNLALNARDAMPDGGTITLTTTIENVTDQPELQSATELQLAPGGYIQISFSDTGTGIDPDDMPHIFEPYFTTKPAARGTGLGLATTYGTITQSGGAITVDSEPTVGTTFTLWIPHNEDSAATEGEHRPDHQRQQAKLVLVVDDDPELRRSIVDELHQHGFNTLVAPDATTALNHLDEPIDLLLTDIELPDINGTTLANTFTEHTPDLPVIVITGAPPTKYLDHLPTNAQLLTKPFTPTQLIEALRSLPQV